MNNVLNLSKEQNKVLDLTKASNNGREFKMQVKLCVDTSGSFKDEFEDGSVGGLLQRAIAFASVIDPDGLVETVAFSDRAKHLGELSTAEFSDPTKVFLERARETLWRGTDYAAALRILTEAQSSPAKAEKTGFFSGLFGKKKEAAATGTASAYPNLVVFVTDGENMGSDSEFNNQLAKLIQNEDTFVVLLGIANAPVNFTLLEKADAKFNGVSFVNCNGMESLSQDQFYTNIVTKELTQFLDKWEAKNGSTVK